MVVSNHWSLWNPTEATAKISTSSSPCTSLFEMSMGLQPSCANCKVQPVPLRAEFLLTQGCQESTHNSWLWVKISLTRQRRWAFLNQVKTKFKFWTQTIKVYSLTFMPKIKYRLVETPMGSTIDSLCEGGYLVCDRDHNCREVLKLWEADDCLREQEIGFDYPYATNFRPTHWLPTTHLPPQWSTAFEVDSWQVLHDHRHARLHRQEQGLTILYRNRRWMVNRQGNVA